MKPEDILQKIVDSDGSCDWADPTICSSCPLSKLKVREDGNPLSCADALDIDGMSAEDSNKLYREVAGRLLAEQAIEDIVERG